MVVFTKVVSEKERKPGTWTITQDGDEFIVQWNEQLICTAYVLEIAKDIVYSLATN